MSVLTSEKLAQAPALVAAAGADAWLTFVRETHEGGDPVLPLLIEGGLTWQSALLVTPGGRRAAVVGNYDADPLRLSGDWHEVVPYVEDFRAPLLQTLESLVPASVSAPRLAVNYSADDVKADGLSHGMYLLLTETLRGSRFENALMSAEEIVMGLRGRKTPTELARVQAAIAETGRLFAEVAGFARVGVSERAVYDFVQARIDERGLGYGWDRAGNPIVNSGPDSMVGHGVPSPDIAIAPGHVFHMDLGVVSEGYSSDVQRCWYAPGAGESEAPEDVRLALDAVCAAISAGADALRPGVPGWEVDAAGRAAITGRGFPEYLHALGHQVGRAAHDGGAILGPRWARYGRTPFLPVQEDEIYTLELGVMVEGRGCLGIEEMVRVTPDGCEWLTRRQTAMPLLAG